jgi:Domain of unknown function (DUF4160)
MPKVAQLSDVISIYVHAHREHPPPHFHVWGPGSDAKVRIDNQSIIMGAILRNYRLEVLTWAFDNQDLLQAKWDEYNERD